MGIKRNGDNELETDVLIIGGGLAGLTAAMGLRDSGLGCLVLEQGERLGGRAQSWRDKKTGDPLHIGPHIFLSEYPNMLKLMDQLGTKDRVVWQRDRFIRMVEGESAVDMKLAPLPAPLHYAPSLFEDSSLRARDLLSNMKVSLLAAQVDEADIKRFDGLNAYALLRSLGVTEYFIQRFWQFSAMAIMNVPLELCSAGALLRFYQRLIGHRQYDVGFPDGGLGDLFAPQAKDALEQAGHQVLLQTGVAQLQYEGDRVTGAVLEDGRRVRSRFCVAALPPQALRRLIPKAWLSRFPVFSNLVRFHPCPYVSTYLWFDRRLTREQFWARRYDPNDLNCDFYDFSNIYSDWGERGSLIGSNCIFCERASELSDEEIVEQTVEELSEYLPEARHAKLEHSAVHRIPMAIHCPYPGTERMRPDVRTPLGGLHLAGDWIATGLPSSMESACLSGWWAAEAVLEDLGRPRSLAEPQKPMEGFVALAHHATRLLRLPYGPRWLRPGAKSLFD